MTKFKEKNQNQEFERERCAYPPLDIFRNAKPIIKQTTSTKYENIKEFVELSFLMIIRTHIIKIITK